MGPPQPGVIDLAKTSIMLVWRAGCAMTLPFAVLFTGFAWIAVAEVALFKTSPPPINLASLTYSLFGTIASSVLTAILAVFIHRFVILREVNQISDVRRLSLVIAEFAVVTLILQLAFLAWGIFSFAIYAAGSVFVIAAIVMLLVVFYVSFRIFLVFPAIAVETPGRSLRSAFRFGAGLVWSLFFAGLLCAVPIMLASRLVKNLTGGSTASISALAGVAFDMVVIATGVTIASQLFAWRMRQLASWDEEAR